MKADAASDYMAAFDKPVWPTSMLRYGPPVWGLSMFTSAGSATGVWTRSSLL
jgi:hypothetical protein